MVWFRIEIRSDHNRGRFHAALTNFVRASYALVRHPGYAAAALLVVGMALALGSYWALVPAIISLGLLVVRTILEDRTLREELPGYEAYARRVRYRLVPGVW